MRDYSRSTFAPLRYTENDVEALARSLTSLGSGYSRVRVLTTTRGRKGPGDAPTAANIHKALAELLDDRVKGDTVLVALSGHGLQLEVDDPDGKGPTKTVPFFCPSDANLLGVSYRTGRSKYLVNLNDLFDRLGKCGAGTKLVLIDACRNELKAQSATRNVALDQVTVPRGVAVLFSCASGQRSFETDRLRHGVFFHYVLEGLRGNARNRRGIVTWDSLAEYVKEQVSSQVASLVGGGARQTPQEVRNLSGPAPRLVPSPLLRSLHGHNGWVYRLVVTPDGKQAVTSGDYLRVWDLSTGKELRRFAPNALSWALALSADGKHLLAGLADHSVRLYEVSSGKELRKFTGHSHQVWAVGLSPDGRLAVSGAVDRTLHVWDIRTGKWLRSFQGVPDYPRCATFSPDGRQVAVGHFGAGYFATAPGTVRVWDVATGKLLRSGTPHGGAITAVAWSRDGKWIASSSFDKTVRIWNAGTLREHRRLTVSTQGSDGVAFTPDARRVVTAGWQSDWAVRVWDVASGREVRRFDGHTGSALCVAVTPDGSRAVSGATDGTVRLWRMPR